MKRNSISYEHSRDRWVDIDIVGLALQLIKIHSPMRADPNRDVKWLPSHDTIAAARIASEKILA